MFNLKKKIKKELFNLSASLIILLACCVGFMCLIFLSVFLTELQFPYLFIIPILVIGGYGVVYIHYKVTKYLEKFEKKDKSDRDKEIDNLFEWNPKK